MKTTMFISLLALAPMVAVSSGCATSQMPGEQIDDATITTSVATKLAADPDIRKHNIDVDTQNQVVTLSGNVESEAEKKEAEQIARDTMGVQSVQNQLEVGADQDMFDGNPDTWITTKVKSQLAADLETRAMNVDVDTNDRVVTLRGMVNEQADKQRAEEIARNTEGVTQVKNELQISELGEEGATMEGQGPQSEAQGPQEQDQMPEEEEGDIIEFEGDLGGDEDETETDEYMGEYPTEPQ